MRYNIFGGPGVGKSTLAAKMYPGSGCELVQEFVKVAAYNNLKVEGWDCLLAFSAQFEREYQFLKHVDIITDSPLLLQVIYAKLNNCPVWEELLTIALTFEDEHPSMNFFLPRFVPYTNKGRFQSEEEAIEVDKMIIEHLNLWKIPCITLSKDCFKGNILFEEKCIDAYNKGAYKLLHNIIKDMKDVDPDHYNSM